MSSPSSAAVEIDLDSNPEKVNDGNENFQGPHNWRKDLRPVGVMADKEEEDERNSDVLQADTVRTAPPYSPWRDSRSRHSRDDKPDGSKIREKLRGIPPLAKRDSDRRRKGPMMTKSGIPTPNSNPANAFSSSGSSSNLLITRRRMMSSPAVESAFTRNVVNNCAIGVHSTGLSKRRVSPQNSFRHATSGVSVVRRTPSFSSVSESGLSSSEVSKKRIEKVLHARLYLLQQTGPNSFLIGGDSPDHKFRVVIGAQNCSCGRGPHCVHLLFVMLRVFKLSENDARLWAKSLKNFEVESLFRYYRSQRFKHLNSKDEIKKGSHSVQEGGVSSPAVDADTQTGQAESDTSSKDDEETCPICLLEMLEGESLLRCDNGCQNRLHHHCITIWFEECRRQNEALICPLCRAEWKTSTSEQSHSHVSDQRPEGVPSNNRPASPQHDIRLDSDTLPHAEPIPQDSQDTARPWIQVLGDDLVACLFSCNWVIRETALRHLSRVVMASLLRSAGEGRSGAMVSSERQEANRQMLECCCGVLAYMCADPVYRVFVACLRVLRTMLSYTPCRAQSQQARLQSLLKPVVDAVLIKCTDGNRRTSQLSVSTIIELAKGQSGELAVGKEIINSGTLGLGGVSYVLECITEPYESIDVQWQWLLGRLYILDKLFEEFLDHFKLQMYCELSEDPSYNNLMKVAEFTIKVVSFSHMRIGRLARRLFLMVAQCAAPNKDLIDQLFTILAVAEPAIVAAMRRKINQIASELYFNEQVGNDVRNLSCPHGNISAEMLNPSLVSSVSSVVLPSVTYSPGSTPRCTSPVFDTPEHLQTVTDLTIVEPIILREQLVELHINSPDSLTINNGPVQDHSFQIPTQEIKVSSHQCETKSVSNKNPSHMSLDKCSLNNPTLVQKSISDHREQASYSLIRPQNTAYMCHPSGSQSDSVLNGTFRAQDNAVHGINKSVHEPPQDVSLPSCSRQMSDYLPSRGNNISPTVLNACKNNNAVRPAEENDEDSKDISAKSGKISKGKALAKTSIQKDLCDEFQSPPHRSVTLTEDLGDLSFSPLCAEQAVSFKTEVATTTPPKTSPSQSGDQAPREDPESDCPCKEEVELEEAVALAKALEASSKQDPCPVVPGLTPTDREEVITIRIQPDGNISSNGTKSGNGAPLLYMENIHWVKGPLLGTGAYSTCFQARDVKTGVIMAIKQLSFCRNSVSEQEGVVKAITEEIYMMANLNHPNVVRILGATRQGCHFNMFVEWMSGGSVAYLLDKYGAFSETVVISYTQQILRGLAYLHDCHLLHRDLKGANLLVDSTGQRLRIGDFGAAARLASQATGAGEFQGQLLGTIAFMAPEVLRGENYGRSCDVWSVGCVMIEMCTTQPPWDARAVTNHLKLIFKIATSERPPTIPTNIAPPIKDVMLRCLELLRADRPTAKDLLLHPLFTQYKVLT